MISTSVTTAANDDEILVRLRAGDPTACDACVRAHSNGLFRLARRMLGDEREAEDVVQETFFSAWKSLDAFDGRARLGTWLFRIAYNAALMRLRNKHPVESLDEDDSEGTPLLERVTAWDETPEELAERKETAGILDEAVDALPATLRTAFVLRDLEERSTAETAQILGVSETVVKVRLHRARLALRERLGKEFGTGPTQVPTLTCEQVAQYLSDYLDKEIDAPLKKLAEEHIATCNHCHVLLDTTQKTLSLYHAGKPHVIPIAERERLYREIQAAFKRRKPS